MPDRGTGLPRYGVSPMPKKPILFPAPPTAEERQPLSHYHSRMILATGHRRLAFDFSRVAELNQTPARLLPFDSGKSKRSLQIAPLGIKQIRRRSNPVSASQPFFQCSGSLL